MPTSSRNHQEKNKLGKVSEKSASFHGRNSAFQPTLRRPKTDPDLLSGRKSYIPQPEASPKLSKLLLNVTIERSLGVIHVVMSPDSTVGDLIAAAVRQYVKEGIRPLLQATDPARFDLHYSTFSLESLDREERLMNLGSRNFFMCRSNKEVDHVGVAKTTSSSSCASSCSKEADKDSKSTHPWQKIMEFFA